jgi:mono/diheme cytochrome c family protein
MKRIFPIVAFGIIMAVALSVQTGCYYDNEEDLYPFDNVCDTSNVTLNANIKGEILLPNCYGCHSASAAAASGAGINLEDYNSLKDWADNGKLFCSVDHGNGCSAMPKGGGRLPQCDIDKIKAWVDRGALDN